MLYKTCSLMSENSRCAVFVLLYVVVIQKDVLVHHIDVFNNMTVDKKKILKTATR